MFTNQFFIMLISYFLGSLIYDIIKFLTIKTYDQPQVVINIKEKESSQDDNET